MPPQASFTREKILARALAIVRREGLGALSARKIAQDMHCSTRPIYTAFRSMEEIQAAVIEEARRYALRYLLAGAENSTHPFLDLGMRYFHFAREETALFRLLYLDGRMGITPGKAGEPFDSLLDPVKRDPRMQGLDQASLRRIGVNMWIYTHGLVSLTYSLPREDAEDFVRDRLLAMGRILFERELNQRGASVERNGGTTGNPTTP